MVGLVLVLLASTLPDAPAAAPGRRIELEGLGATLFVPDGYRAGPGGAVDVVLHLHGAASAVEPALRESGWAAVLIEFNRKGLSRAYAEPFSDPTLFPRLLAATRTALENRKLSNAPRIGRVVVSSFSAGFGGVRELLKVPEHFARVDGLVMADSLYCGYRGDPARREVDPVLMGGFRRFAAEAAAGRKTFVLTHSAQIPEGYASTTETADDLIRSLGPGSADAVRDWPPSLTPARSYARGRFLVLGFAGAGGPDHLAHLRRIGAFWKRFRALAPPARG